MQYNHLMQCYYKNKKKHFQSIKAIEKYLQSNQDTPTHVCDICETLYFEKEMLHQQKHIVGLLWPHNYN